MSSFLVFNNDNHLRKTYGQLKWKLIVLKDKLSLTFGKQAIVMLNMLTILYKLLININYYIHWSNVLLHPK